MFKFCPECNKKIEYVQLRFLEASIRKNSLCKSCCMKGNRNPFFKKEHSEETKNKIRKSNIEKQHIYKSDDFRNKISDITTGKNNGMYGKCVYDIWLEKYGKEVAEQKMVELKKKQSMSATGDKNPMFGKPSPNGSGNGWSGWYKDKFFKSLRELNYVLYLEKNKIKYESAENKKFMVSYVDWNGKKRNYFPDFFLIDSKTLIECKPLHLHNSVNVLCKKKYADEYCNKNGYTYKIIDPGKIDDSLLLKIYNNNEIKFIDKYEIKMKERIKLN